MRIFKTMGSILKKVILSFSQRNLLIVHEIDSGKRIAIISGRGNPSTISLGFDQIAQDPEILTNIPSIPAAWIGYYHGLNGMPKGSGRGCIGESFSASSRKGAFRMLSLDRRGHVTFTKHITGEQASLPIISILSDSKILENFSSAEAYYLGLWQSIYMTRHAGRKKYETNSLRVVK